MIGPAFHELTAVEQREAVLDALRDGPATRREICRRVGAQPGDDESVGRALQALRIHGRVIKADGCGRSHKDHRWELVTKNLAAVQLGRLGGLKGGAARAASLSPERRREIAAKAAAARWSVKR